jgi:hypothetical protein
VGTRGCGRGSLCERLVPLSATRSRVAMYLDSLCRGQKFRTAYGKLGLTPFCKAAVDLGISLFVTSHYHCTTMPFGCENQFFFGPSQAHTATANNKDREEIEQMMAFPAGSFCSTSSIDRPNIEIDLRPLRNVQVSLSSVSSLSALCPCCALHAVSSLSSGRETGGGSPIYYLLCPLFIWITTGRHRAPDIASPGGCR